MLLFSSYFFLQTWHIPLTWVFGLLMGALLPNVLLAFLVTHVINIVGVACTCTLSKTFLGPIVRDSDLFKKQLANLNDKVQEQGLDSAVYTMISIRLIPGSPNYIYNVVLPHVDSLKLRHILVGVTIGQAPYNYIIAQAGKMIGTIKSKADIFTSDIVIGLSIMAFLFCTPPLIKFFANK